MRNWINIVEGKFRENDIEEFVPNNDALDDLKLRLQKNLQKERG